MPLVTTTLGASFEDGNTPIGCPEYTCKVCSSVIMDRYCMVRRYCAQFWNTAPLPPYVINSSGCCATEGSKLFWIISIMAAACAVFAGYSSMGRAYIL